ncbi:hypothetical protein [Marinoscillum sp.]|uniref:hypothetical protein n=1 Tax=Marinoscillum sp. TaxID=2024838 RepID=UPI003BAA9779
MDQENKHLVNIPSSFYSFKEEGPFQHCVECDRFLLDESCDYVIEKAVRNYPGFKASDVIFDYAICMDCAMEVQKGLSTESMTKIQEFMQEHLQQKMRTKESASLESYTDHCLVSNRAVSECEEFQIFAYCRGSKVNLQMPPYMISGQVLDEISELLSPETRDELDGFFNKHFAPDPGLMEPNPRLVLI